MTHPRLYNSNNILGDQYMVELLNKNYNDTLYLFKDCVDSLCTPVLLENKYYMLFNTGINPFTNKQIPNGSKLIIYNDYNFWENLLIKKKNILLENQDTCDMINSLLKEKDFDITTIPVYSTHKKLFYTKQTFNQDLLNNDDDDEKSNYKFFIILPSKFIETYNNLPIINPKQLKDNPPVLIVPKIWTYLRVMSAAYKNKSLCAVNLDNEKIEFDLPLLIMFLSNGRRILSKELIFKDQNVFYFYFYDIDDVPHDIAIKNPDSTYHYAYKKMINDYKNFATTFFSIEHEFFITFLKDKVDIIKYKEIFFVRENTQFINIIQDIINFKYVVTSCKFKNINSSSPFFNKYICEIFDNDIGISNKGMDLQEIDLHCDEKSFFEKINYNIKEIISKSPLTKMITGNKKNNISEEEIQNNIDFLLKQEEHEKQIIKNKELEIKRKNDENAKKHAQAKIIKQHKALAKKIAYEARDHLNKINNIKKKELAKHETKMKIIAKALAYEAKVFIENKIQQKQKELELQQQKLKELQFQQQKQKELQFQQQKQKEIINLEKIPKNKSSNKNNKKERTIKISDFTNNDDEYCEINSSEYFRRINQWNLQKINPNIFCFPMNYIKSLHPSNSKNVFNNIHLPPYSPNNNSTASTAPLPPSPFLSPLSTPLKDSTDDNLWLFNLN